MDSVLIVNRTAGRRAGGELVAAVVERLRAGGYRPEVRPTSAPGDASDLAREAAAAGARAVFALGGDGTLREAAAGLLGTDTALGPLPGGTANVLTLALGLPRRAEAAAAAVAAARPRAIDAGLAAGRPFLMMASAGLDSRLVSRLHPIGRWGRLGIAARGLGAWWSYDYPPLEVELDGERHRVTFASVSNIRYYGGPFRLAPGARPDDGRLDLVLFRGRGRLATLGFLADVLHATQVERDDVEIVPVTHGQRVVLRGPEDTCVQVDGDPCAAPLPLAVELAKDRLRILAP